MIDLISGATRPARPLSSSLRDLAKSAWEEQGIVYIRPLKGRPGKRQDLLDARESSGPRRVFLGFRLSGARPGLA